MFTEILKTVLVSLGMYANSNYPISNEEMHIIHKLPGGKFRFYTYLSNYIAIFALLLGYLRRFKFFYNLHSFFMTFSLCTQFTLVSFYWIMAKLYPTFVMAPKIENEQLRILVNLSLHLLIFVACILDPLEIYGRGLLMTCFLFIFSLGYIIFSCYFNNIVGTWPYAFLDEMTNIQILFFFLMLIFLPLAFYKVIFGFKPKKARKIRKNKQE
ncbi:hypothetical protein NUSPORA_00128 [Nucleospora cyclopteri]